MNLSKTFGSLGTSAQVTSVFSKRDIQDLTAIYNYYDVDHNGTVTGANVKHMLFALGFVIEDDFVSATRLYSRDEFLNTAAQLFSKDKVRRDEKKLSRKVFQMIDYGGHGTVDPVALKRFMESTGVHVTMEQAENFVATADRGEDGLTFGLDDMHNYLQKFYYPFMEDLKDRPDSDEEEERRELERKKKQGIPIDSSEDERSPSPDYSVGEAGSPRSNARSEAGRDSDSEGAASAVPEPDASVAGAATEALPATDGDSPATDAAAGGAGGPSE